MGNWDPLRKVVMRYPVRADGRLGQGEVLADLSAAPGSDAIDGIKVDVRGHLFVSGPGGLWVISADGRHLGTIRAPRQVHNMAWGDSEGNTLYLTAHDKLYRMPLAGTGVRPPVIEPNPVTSDMQRGFFIGDLNVVTAQGAVSLHEAPLEFRIKDVPW